MQHTLHKGTHIWDNMSPWYVKNSMPKIHTPIHLTFTTWPREEILGKHSLTWGLAYRIGKHDTAPILKFGKIYEVFEHLFNLKRGIWCTCLGGSYIKCGLLGMIHVTCGPLEGVLVSLCTTLPTRWMMDFSCGIPWMMNVAPKGQRTLPLEAPGHR